MHTIRAETMSGPMRDFMLALMLDTRNEKALPKDTLSWSLSATDAEGLRAEILSKLHEHRMKRSTLFCAMDLNGSYDLQVPSPRSNGGPP